MEKMLIELEKTLTKIHDDIVNKATPVIYVSGGFDKLVDECFDSENGMKLNILIEQIGEDRAEDYLKILDKCNKRYEEALTKKLFNCFAPNERD